MAQAATVAQAVAELRHANGFAMLRSLSQPPGEIELIDRYINLTEDCPMMSMQQEDYSHLSRRAPRMADLRGPHSCAMIQFVRQAKEPGSRFCSAPLRAALCPGHE